jgi:hypothetical protein
MRPKVGRSVGRALHVVFLLEEGEEEEGKGRLNGVVE